METRLEGIVHARRYDPEGRGKQFLGAVIECSDEKVWVIAYEEQSAFHEFAGRRVVAFGEPYQPEGQHLIGWGGGKQLGHFHVATVRPAEVTPDLELAEVGPGHKLGGRLERETSDAGESKLFFITQEGDTFLAANDPIGAAVGRDVEVWAYCVQLSPLTPRPPGRYLWIICPYSAADLWEWRRKVLKKASDVTQREGDHSLVIFKFSGIHDHTHGRQMDEYMRSLVGTSPGAGIIIDLLDYGYVYGNDMTALFMVGFDQRSKALRPVCLVAVGGTRSGLESLLAASKFASEGGLDVAIVPTIEEARQAVSAMRKTAVQQPQTAYVSPPVLPAAGPTVASAGQRFPIDFPWLEGFVLFAVAAMVTALVVRTHSTLSLISVGVVMVIGALFMAANLTYVIRAWAGVGEPSHIIPIIGGVLVAIGLWRFPVDIAHRWWWIPLMIDPGCLLIAGSLIWELTFGKRDPH